MNNSRPFHFSISHCALCIPHCALCIVHCALALALCAATGCLVGPDYERPETGLPVSYLPGTLGDGATNTFADASWWRAFNDPLLFALVERGLEQNLGVQQAVQRVRASRAALAASKAAFWPNIGVSAGVTRGKTWNPDETSTRVSAGFDASWEIDLFGGLRRGAEASKAELAATEYALADARLSLAAEIAGEYVSLRQQQAEYEIECVNLAIQTNFLAIADAKFRAGMANERDRIASEAQCRSLEASLPQSRAAISASMRRIEALLGCNPGELGESLSARSPVPSAPALPASVPSDLLRRRPDVRQAESTYAAAVARIGVAVANRYPSVSIGAGASVSSDSLSDWGEAMKSVSFGPGVKWNILTFGRDKAKVEQARAGAEEAALKYREVVLNAVHEVETDWTKLSEERARYAPLLRAGRLQGQAVALSEDMYAKDLGEYQEVLSAQQSLLSANKAIIAQKANCTLHAIALYKALGGDFGGALGK